MQIYIQTYARTHIQNYTREHICTHKRMYHINVPSCFCLLSIANSYKLYTLLLRHHVYSVYPVASSWDHTPVSIIGTYCVCVCVCVCLLWLSCSQFLRTRACKHHKRIIYAHVRVYVDIDSVHVSIMCHVSMRPSICTCVHHVSCIHVSINLYMCPSCSQSLKLRIRMHHYHTYLHAYMHTCIQRFALELAGRSQANTKFLFEVAIWTSLLYQFGYSKLVWKGVLLSFEFRRPN